MPISADSPCIDLRDVTYRYRGADALALDRLSLDVPRGVIFGLLGPNGAGKSTLLRLLSGSLEIQEGAIRIDGAAASGQAHGVKRKTALTPQDYAFYEELTGRENLDFFAGVHGLSRVRRHERIASCARICRLDEVLDRRAGRYSGGLKRRLNLAIALLNEPRILYLDEPTVGIDAESRQYIVAAVRALQQAGVTIVYTSHYMEEVEQLCDVVAIIDHGRVIARERTDELLRREGGETLHVRLRTPSPALLEPLGAYRPRHIDYRLWTLSAPRDQLVAALEVFHAHGALIERVQYGVSRLETIYMQLLAEAQP